MNLIATPFYDRRFMSLTLAIVICLILLINVSFKIIVIHGLFFTANSILCSLIAGLYLLVLKNYSLMQQRQVLNQSLLALYLFSIGVYLLLNLPSIGNIRNTIAYQIVFEEIPRKFFSSTIAFGISFYLPHLLISSRYPHIFNSPRKCMLLALLGGYAFFSIDFLLLFSEPYTKNFGLIYMDSLLITASILLLIGISFLTYLLTLHNSKNFTKPDYFFNHYYHYLTGLAVIVLLICFACEYRLISFGDHWIIAANGILFPFTMLISSLVGELFGYRANLYLIFIMILAELVFDLLFLSTILLPSPDFFNLNPYYSFIMPKRIPLVTLAILIAFSSNAFLLEKFNKNNYITSRFIRILTASILANTLLCIINYTILLAGIYPYEELFNLSLSGWIYKFIVTVLSLPFVIYLYNKLQKKQKLKVLT
ncbi:VUT family protein [Legionella gresilensis]|uniref:VUT family protein n=1 Tax=Legionella gresilensis TaxID=91823 RepID=UPI0013EF670B|nr:VUT family protein [Legionella gresilensis]